MIKTCINALSKLREVLNLRRSGDELNDIPVDSLSALVKSVREARYSAFSCHEIEGILDFEEQLSTSWDEFESLNSTEWEEIRSIVDAGLAGALLTYSMRMSIFAVRRRDVRRLRDAVMALVVDKDLLDYRDVVTYACLVYDAATRIGADPDALFRAGIRYATPDRRNLLEQYLAGPTYNKSIRSMGFDAAETKVGFVYRIRLD